MCGWVGELPARMEMAIRVATATNAQSKELSEVNLTIKMVSANSS